MTTQLTRQRGAAHGLMVSATHAAGRGVDLYRESLGHLAAGIVDLMAREVNPKTGAAGTAGGAIGYQGGAIQGVKDLRQTPQQQVFH